MNSKSQLRLMAGLMLLSGLLVLPGMSNLLNPPIMEEEVWASAKEIARIPISKDLLGKTITKKFRVLPSRINNQGSLGDRHFQISVVSPGISRSMQAWDQNAIKVNVFVGGTQVPLKETRTGFYLHSQSIERPVGMWFDPKNDDLCEVSIKFESNPFQPESEVVLAPNWDNPMYLKDRIVGSMLNPTFMRIFGWAQGFALLILGGCSGWTLILLKRQSNVSSRS